MLTERDCWDRIYKIVRPAWKSEAQEPLSTAEVEKLNAYVNLILIRRRVEALEVQKR